MSSAEDRQLEAIRLLGDAYIAGGYALLQANPNLTIQYFGFQSANIGKNGKLNFGFSGPLQNALGEAGFETILSKKLLGFAGIKSNPLGLLGEQEVADLYKAQGLTVSQKVSILGGSREIDVVGQKSGFSVVRPFMGSRRSATRAFPAPSSRAISAIKSSKTPKL